VTRAARIIVALVLALVAAAAPAGATTLVNETFSHSAPDNPNWLVGELVGTNSVSPCLTAGTGTSQTPIPGCPPSQPSIPAGGDPNGQGALRLTSNIGDNTGFVLYQAALPFTAGLDVTFSFYDYNTIPTFVSTGADGVSFFLADGSKPLTTPGGFGGSLGYAQTTDPFPVAGILGGYLGVGFDEFGNFGNNTEGRGGRMQPARRRVLSQLRDAARSRHRPDRLLHPHPGQRLVTRGDRRPLRQNPDRHGCQADGAHRRRPAVAAGRPHPRSDGLRQRARIHHECRGAVQPAAHVQVRLRREHRRGQQHP
jgi:Bacterial lectin